MIKSNKFSVKSFGKAVLLLLSMWVLIFILPGCTDKSASAKDEKTILVSGFAQYDWLLNIIKDNPSEIVVRRLNESGTDMHSYQPTVKDMVEISECDLLIYTGGESEFWIDGAVISSEKSDSSCLSLMEIFEGPSLLCENYTEAHSEHEHEHEHELHQGHDHNHEGEADEHLWLSLKMAPVFIGEITEAICALDPANASYYRDNSDNYIGEIKKLDSSYENAAASAHNLGQDCLIVADRFPFVYLTEDYHLAHLAAFPGCSAETEASFATILSLSEAIDEHNPGAVFVLKKSKTDLAQTVIKNSHLKDLPILRLDDMQSVTPDDIDSGLSYISVMQDNLTALEEAFGINTDR